MLLGDDLELITGPDLPINVWCKILSFLDINSIWQSVATCKTVHKVLLYTSFWKKISSRHFGAKSPCNSLIDWKLYYQQKTLLTPDRMHWVSLNSTNVPPNRYQHTCICAGDNLYVIGGQVDPLNRFNTISCFDTNSLNWHQEQVQGPIPKFSRHTSDIAGEDIWCYGGFDGFTEQFGLQKYNITTKIWERIETENSPISRTNHATSICGNKFYLFGGLVEQNGILVDLNDLHCLDLETLIWTEIHPSYHDTINPDLDSNTVIPEPRCGHSLHTFNDKLILLGGGSGEGWTAKFPVNSIYIFDTKTQKWSRKDCSGHPVRIFSFAGSICFSSLKSKNHFFEAKRELRIGAFLFLFGGITLDNDSGLSNSLYVLDTLTFKWENLSKIQRKSLSGKKKYKNDSGKPMKRDMASGCFVNGNAYIFGGFRANATQEFDKLAFDDYLSKFLKQNIFTTESPRKR